MFSRRERARRRIQLEIAKQNDALSQFGYTHLSEVLKTERVPRSLVYDRSSISRKALKGHLKGTKRIIADNGIRLLRAFSEVANGKSLDRSAFLEALRFAREKGVPLIVPCFSRLLRHRDYDAIKNPEARPTEQDIRMLLSLTEGVRILVINHPDSTIGEDKNFLGRISL